MKTETLPRGAGVLLPVFSLSAGYGIGDLGKSAFDFVDFLAEAGQKYWQVLPLGPTGFGNSPYASHSAFAGNPYFIPFSRLPVNRVTEECVGQLKEGDESRVDYTRLYRFRNRLLAEYLDAFPPSLDDVLRFARQEKGWIEDYVLYRIAKEREAGRPWWLWQDLKLRTRDPEALASLAKDRTEQRTMILSEQYLFHEAWRRLKGYANKSGIRIIGDLPLYVALDSADVWANGEDFLLDEDGLPSAVAGVPPDQFSKTGQLWGNPIYHWQRMEKGGFAWWRRRIEKYAGMFDAVRIDHFIGLSGYYAIPRGREDATIGSWNKGPGEKIVRLFAECRIPMIAEDLGVMTEEVERLKMNYGIPGMKILQFAFNGDPSNSFLPHRHEENAVIYGGTHDNETLRGYFSAGGRNHRFAADYLGTDETPSALQWACIRQGLSSVSRVAIFTMADWLGMDNRARINTPGMPAGNWEWRLGRESLSMELARKMRSMAERYER